MGIVKKSIVKKIFENSKGKRSQEERKKSIQNILSANNFEDFIDKIESAKSNFGTDEKKSNTLCLFKEILNFKNNINELYNDDKVFKAIENLKSGKMINGKNPGLVSTITSKDCKKIGEKLKELWFKYYCDNVETINCRNPFFGDLELKKYEFKNAKTIKNGAFFCLKSLEELSFPKVKTVEEDGIYNCENLKIVRLSHAEKVDDCAFYLCDKLKEHPENIILPKKIDKKNFKFSHKPLN